MSSSSTIVLYINLTLYIVNMLKHYINKLFNTFSIHINTFIIVTDFILKFFGTYSMNLKIVFSATIGLLELYNFAVHQIYIT